MPRDGSLARHAGEDAGWLLLPGIHYDDSVTKSKFDDKRRCHHSLMDCLNRAREKVWDTTRGPLLAHGISLIVAAVVLLWSARDVDFFWDDWALLSVLGGGDVSLGWFLTPHNEHWLVLPKALYWLIFEWLGASAAWPYVAVTILLHVVLAHLLWRLSLRSGAHVWFASVACFGFAVFPGGVENILFAVQMGLVGSAVLGTAAVLELSRPHPRPLMVVSLTGLSIMTFGLATVFIVVCAALIVMQREWRRLLYLLPALLLLALYTVAYGTRVAGPLTGVEDLPLVALFWAVGVGMSLNAVVPWRSAADVVHPVLTPVVGFAALAATTVIVALLVVAGKVRHWRPGLAAWAFLLGCPTAWLVMAMSRVSFGLGSALSSRYIYVGAMFLLPFVVTFVSRVSAGVRVARMVLLVVFVVVAAANVMAWRSTAETWSAQTQSRARVLLAGQTLARSGSPMFPDIGATPQFAFLSIQALRALDLTSVDTKVRPSDALEASLAAQVRLVPVEAERLTCEEPSATLSIDSSERASVIHVAEGRIWELYLRDPRTSEISAAWPRQIAAGYYEVEWKTRGKTLILDDRFGRKDLSSCRPH